MDLAASIQAVTEEVMLRIGRHLHAETGIKNLVLAGGVALNCVANGRLAARGAVRGDLDSAGGRRCRRALWGGAVRLAPALAKAAPPGRAGCPAGELPGPGLFGRGDRPRPRVGRGLRPAVRRTRRRCSSTSPGSWPKGRSSAGSTAGWSSARAALGARSILGDPRSPEMQATMNLKIKFRESFRPFAPCVLQEHAHEWFGLEPGQESPYMLLVAPVLEEHRVPIDPEAPGGDAATIPTCAAGSTWSAPRPGGDPRRLQRPGPDGR